MGKRASIESVLRDLDDIAVRADAHRRGTMKSVDRGPKATAVGEARQLHVGSAMLAGSVPFDSAVEHHRGSFKNKVMFLALGSAAARLVAGIYGASREVPRATSSWTDNDKTSIAHGLGQMSDMLRGAGAFDIFDKKNDTNLLYGAARMGSSSEDSVVDSDHRWGTCPTSSSATARFFQLAAA